MVEIGRGRDDANEVPADHSFRVLRVFHLVADRDLESAADQAADVGVGRVIGDAAHGDGGAARVLLARGERDLEGARRGERVVEEHLVEVAHAEEEDRVRHLALDVVVLTHGGRTRSRRFRARSWSTCRKTARIVPRRACRETRATNKMRIRCEFSPWTRRVPMEASGSSRAKSSEVSSAHARRARDTPRVSFPTIDHLLRLHSLRLEEIDGFAVAVGPGSFTGPAYRHRGRRRTLFRHGKTRRRRLRARSDGLPLPPPRRAHRSSHRGLSGRGLRRRVSRAERSPSPRGRALVRDRRGVSRFASRSSLARRRNRRFSAIGRRSCPRRGRFRRRSVVLPRGRDRAPRTGQARGGRCGVSGLARPALRSPRGGGARRSERRGGYELVPMDALAPRRSLSHRARELREPLGEDRLRVASSEEPSELHARRPHPRPTGAGRRILRRLDSSSSTFTSRTSRSIPSIAAPVSGVAFSSAPSRKGRARGARAALLEVRRSNAAAQSLYRDARIRRSRDEAAVLLAASRGCPSVSQRSWAQRPWTHDPRRGFALDAPGAHFGRVSSTGASRVSPGELERSSSWCSRSLPRRRSIASSAPRANRRSGPLRRLSARSRGALPAAAACRERRHLLLRPASLASSSTSISTSRTSTASSGPSPATFREQRRRGFPTTTASVPLILWLPAYLRRARARSARALSTHRVRLSVLHRRRDGDGLRGIRRCGVRLSPPAQLLR